MPELPPHSLPCSPLCSPPCSPWVVRFAPLIPAAGRVLDLACGSGRHARLLADLGYHVVAVDRDPQALAGLTGQARITAQLADLEQGAWPYEGASFDGIVVTNYLHRPRFAALLAGLRQNGVLIYETFMSGQEALGRPASPEFLLQPGELLERVQSRAEGRLTVVAFEQGRIERRRSERPGPACVQRICARAGIVGTLPAAG